LTNGCGDVEWARKIVTNGIEEILDAFIFKG